MVKPKEQNAELFFVRVKEPNEARRNILEALKEIVEVLQKFEKFRRIRHEKLENIHKLRVLLKDANKMLGSLKSKLPQTSLRATVMKEQRAHKKTHHKKGKKAPAEEKAQKAPKKEMTELDRLEAQLGAIESKLKSLT